MKFINFEAKKKIDLLATYCGRNFLLVSNDLLSSEPALNSAPESNQIAIKVVVKLPIWTLMMETTTSRLTYCLKNSSRH